MDGPQIASNFTFPLAVTSLGAIKTNADDIIAIDFGTTYSGFAYVNKNDPEHITCGAPGLPSGSEQVKTPTVLLKNGPGSDWTFGQEALEKHNGICHERQKDVSDNQTMSDVMKEKGVSLFRDFKMQLKDKTSGMESLTANSTFGTPHNLMDLITRSLEFLSQYALGELKNGWMDPSVRATDESIQWVLTVPAIWNDFGKAFMRKAAFKAGLINEEGSDRLIIALEPESAALAVHSVASSRGILKQGECFVVLDCGGGTVDITSHRVATDNPLVLDEICLPVGGPWGGMYVDLEFQTFLRKLLGSEIFEKLESKYPAEFSEVVDDFRRKKESFIPGTGNAMTEVSLEDLFSFDVMDGIGLSPLVDLVNAYNASYGSGAAFDLSESKISKKIINRNTLLFSESQMLEFFEPTLKNICYKMKRIMDEHKEVKTIAVVGGYGSSKALGNRIRDEFARGGVRVIVPTPPLRPQAAVVQGAACFGLYTSVVGSRVSGFTYGVRTNIRWYEGCGYPRSDAEFDEKLKELRVPDTFSRIVKKASISPGERFHRKGFSALYNDHTTVSFQVYKSSEYKPKRVDKNCERIGNVVADCRSTEDEFGVEFSFESELKVRVTRQDGKSWSTVIQYD